MSNLNLEDKTWFDIRREALHIITVRSAPKCPFCHMKLCMEVNIKTCLVHLKCVNLFWSTKFRRAHLPVDITLSIGISCTEALFHNKDVRLKSARKIHTHLMRIFPETSYSGRCTISLISGTMIHPKIMYSVEGARLITLILPTHKQCTRASSDLRFWL